MTCKLFRLVFQKGATALILNRDGCVGERIQHHFCCNRGIRNRAADRSETATNIMGEIVGQGDDRAIVRILTTDVLTQVPSPDFCCGCPQPMQGRYGGEGIVNPWR